MCQYLTNKINDFNANTIFLFYIKITYCISMRKYKQNQDRDKNNFLKKKKNHE